MNMRLKLPFIFILFLALAINPTLATSTDQSAPPSNNEYSVTVSLATTVTTSAIGVPSPPDSPFNLLQWLSQNAGLMVWISGAIAGMKYLYGYLKNKFRPFPNWELILNRLHTMTSKIYV
jgi:hypothetical protein